jgi:hypothetical protein
MTYIAEADRAARYVPAGGTSAFNKCVPQNKTVTAGGNTAKLHLRKASENRVGARLPTRSNVAT